MEQLSLDRVGRPISQAGPEQEAALATPVEEDNDAILRELCDRFWSKEGVRIGRATIGGHCPKAQAHREKNFARTEMTKKNSS